MNIGREKTTIPSSIQAKQVLAMKRLSNIAANNRKAEEISEIFKHLT
jgi:hypothetical protein